MIVSDLCSQRSETLCFTGMQSSELLQCSRNCSLWPEASRFSAEDRWVHPISFYSLGQHSRNEALGCGTKLLPVPQLVHPHVCRSILGRVLLWDMVQPHDHSISSLALQPANQTRSQGRNAQFCETLKDRYVFCQAVGNEK